MPDRGATISMLRVFAGIALALLATFSTALAEVHDLDPSSDGSAGIDFLYTPTSDETSADKNDQTDAYSPAQIASLAWFGRMLRWTGIDVWLVILRDQFLVDTTDSLDTLRFEAALLALQRAEALYLVNISAMGRGGCNNAPESQQTSCEIQDELLSTGWTNPVSGSGQFFGFGPNGLIGEPGYFPIGRMLFGELQNLMQAASAPQLGSPCCVVSESQGVLNAGPSYSLSQPGWSDDLGRPGRNRDRDRSPEVSSITAYLDPPPAAKQIPASIPEPWTWEMLLIGFAGLGLANYRCFRERRSRP